MVEHNIKLAGACGNGCAGFSQLFVSVLGALVEAYDAGYDNPATFEIGDAALDPREADADALRM